MLFGAVDGGLLSGGGDGAVMRLVDLLNPSP